MSELMPNVSYHSKSVVKFETFTGNSILTASIGGYSTASDTGVFVSGSINAEYPGCPRSNRRITERYYRTTTSGTNYPPIGGINMDTGTDTTSLYSFAIAGYGSGFNSKFVLAFTKGQRMVHEVKPNNFMMESPTYTGMGITQSNSGTTIGVMAEKVEIGRKTDSEEIVYITGVTMVVQVDDEIAYRCGITIARSVPMIGSGFAESTSNGSLLFGHDGLIHSMLAGENAVSASASAVRQAIPEEAIVSNDGILAVSCMAEAEGQAHWLGYKNGIYKLYQGTKPLNGLPGEKVVVKGHDFVCPAYGPYYARMS